MCSSDLVEGSKRTIVNLIKKYNVDIIAIGNGTASRETESFIAEVINENHLDTKYVIVSEAGASVYSASDIAIEEFPDLTLEKRSAISIARRIQDPLAELVKIDPKSIGVGQYQHDVTESKLSKSLDDVVFDAVNRVGVNINTASVSLLSYVSGLNKSVSKNIVNYRMEHEKFHSREELKKVALVGAGKIGTIVADRIMKKSRSSIFRKIFGGSTQKITQDFVIVDSDKSLCDQASERFPNATVFCADVTDEGFITEEGLDKFNLVICATHNHEMNMVVSAYLESLGVKKTVALVAHSAFSDIARKLGVDVVVPLRDTVVDSIMSHLRGKSVTGIHTISSGDFEIIECDLPSTSKMVGKPLKNISRPGEYLLLLVKKTGDSQYELPAGDTMLSGGDHLVLITKTGDKKILELFSGVE